MSIQTDLTRIKNAKAAIKAAIEGKGVTVPDATLLDGMATLIESIEAGGGSGGKAYKIVSGYLSSTSTDTDGSFTLAHNLGCTPILFMMMRPATFTFEDGQIGCVLYGNSDVDESLLPAFKEYQNKKIQTIARYNNGVYVTPATGTIDNNSISFSKIQNGRFTSKVTGAYLWFAVGVEGA